MSAAPDNAEAFAKARFLTWLHDEAGAYRDLRDLGDGRWAGTMQFLFTSAILVGRFYDYGCYDDRWCYRDHAAALAALDAWDGVGEPIGWHRHPATGRRVAPDGTEYVYP